MGREDFNLLNSDIIYFDNAATTLKPICLANSIGDYYNNYSANIHRGDYNISLRAEKDYELSRKAVANFINSDDSEIVFTSGTTDSMNKIIFGFFKDYLKKGDEVLISRSEHASNTLPWFELSDSIGIKVNYIPLDSNYSITMENVINSITCNTKVISLAYVTNVIGDERPIKEIVKYAHEHNILVVVDGAQSIPHMKTDVKDLDVDFLAFSMHKMLGPTGVGVMYGKKTLLEKTKPIIFGGGMNASYSDDGNRLYSDVPYNLEAGTPNIADVISVKTCIDYINEIGLEKINKYEEELKKYAIEKLSLNPNITIYNKNTKSGIISFNYNGIFSQDLAIYLNKYNICVRAGNHCSKILKNELGIKNTVRVSFYFYNTKEEIDKFVSVLNNSNIMNELI